jgi:dipeptidyl aminopeptidase/acylaminoacyl peptidase
MLRAVLITVLAVGSSPAFAYQPAELLRPGVIHGIALSPSGKYLAVGIANAVGITEAIAILDLDREGDGRLVRRVPLATPKAERIVTLLGWASDDYVLAWMNYAYKEPVPATAPRGSLHTIHVGGDGEIKAFDALPGPVRVYPAARPDSRYVYLSAGPVVPGMLGPRPYEVELATGSARLLAEPDRYTLSWRVREGRAVVKFNEGKMGEVSNLYASLSEGEEWTYVNSLRYPADRRNHLEVIAEGESPLDDYLRRTRKGSDVDGIHLRNLETMSITATLFEQPGHDVLFAQIQQGRFVSAAWLDDTLQQRFADPELERHYAGIRRYFGADTSIRATLSSTLAGHWLLYAFGPRNPGEYHVYDPARRHVELINVERPWLEAGRLAPSRPLVVTARDGAQLRAYLTCPESGTQDKRPLVVLPPAGPWDYAYLHFSAYAQAFAAEGWCTVEPNVRGSYGRGRAFQAQGYGQWNARAADDVADTVLTLVKDGTADPARIAGVGELLGGTMLMAAEAWNPGLLKAIVATAPVLDGQSVLRDLKNRFGRTSLAYEDWSEWLGPLGEGSALRKQLFQVRAPMFLIHAMAGSDAPIDDTRALEKELAKSGHAPRTRYVGPGGTVTYTERENVLRLEAIVAFLRPYLAH